MLNPVWILKLVAAAGACCGIVYNLLCLWAAKKFLAARRTQAAQNRQSDGPAPPVSILKPVRGIDPEMYASLRSHCLQDYPAYEIIFGVHEAADPAIELIEKLKTEFPQASIRFQAFPRALGANIKVSNLAQMAPLAAYEYLLVNDSDIRVEPDYLRRVMAEFRDENVGLVTCLYRGVAENSVWSRLEALGISTDFTPGVLMARQLERGVRFGLGSTLAFHKSDLKEIGGFEALADFLADDYEIGARIAKQGKRVAVAEPVVSTFLPEYSWRGFLDHQLRWARGIRDSRPGGYLGLLATYAIPWAVLAVLLARGSGWAWALLALALAVRSYVAIIVGRRVLADAQMKKFLWLVPARDCIAFGLWWAAYGGHTVRWRGSEFVLKNGKIKAKS